MYCPRCGVSNPAGTAACRICGMDLVSAASPVRCPSCGAQAKASQSICLKCGADMSPLRAAEPVVATTAAVEEQTAADVVEESFTEAELPIRPILAEPETNKGRWCPQCGRPKSEYADICEHCKLAEVESSSDISFGTSVQRETDLAMVGGVFIVIAGILGAGQGLVSVADVSGAGLSASVICFTSLMIVFGLLAMIGGVSAISRTNAVHAVLGGVFGILSIGFYFGAVISVIGLLLVIKSYGEFEIRKWSLDFSR